MKMKGWKTLPLRALLPALLLALAPGMTHAAPKVITEGDEIRLGKDASAEFEREMKISTDPVMNAKVRRIGRRLAAVSDRPGLPYQFKVVDTPEINAVAFPGGFIYIFQGLIDVMPSDDALAAIIGHEITHATERHWAEGTERDWLLSLASILLVKTPLASAGSFAGRTLLALDYSRSAETEADRKGFEFLVNAGYDPRGAAQAWDAIMRFSPNKKKIPALLRTHPVDKTRLANLQRMGEEAMENRPPAPALPPDALAGSLSPALAVPESPWIPLRPGSRWTYRAVGAGGQVQRSEWRVTGLVPDSPGAVQLEISLPGAVDLDPWARVTAQGMEFRLRPNDPDSAWKLDTPLPATVMAEEEVTVPAGTFRCARVEKPAGEGHTVTLWVSPGVGVVKRRFQPSGLTEELESFELPSPAQARGADG
ncbi:MAG: M48 family metalloprotease [Armatimonadetes bacterium]|nr:M48 family metalloprotease [Armatimonadota bacterium]